MGISQLQYPTSLRKFIAISFFLLAVMPAGLQSQTQRKKLSESSALPQTRVRHFESKALGRTVQYRVLVPGEYDRSTRYYPVLYLLHGLHGDGENWETRTDLVHYAEKFQFIIVMPDVGDSWYVNAAAVSQDRYEDFIVSDLIPDAEQSWRILRSPHRRAIAGLSMGGYGALKFALRNPGMFSVAASISGALNAPGELASEQPSFARNLGEVFGPPESETRTRNDIYILAREAKVSDNLYLYLDCGNMDWALPSNRDFVKILSDRKYRYECHEFPGAHSWEYWDRRLPALLDVVAKRILQP